MEICFACGAPAAGRAGDPVPICDACRGTRRGGLDNEQWMVRFSESRVVGPHPRRAMLQMIAEEQISPETSICRVGEQLYAPVQQHPDYQFCFIEGTPENKAVQQLRDEFQELGAIERATRAKRLATMGLVVLIGVVVPLAAWKTSTTLLPDNWLERVEGMGASAPEEEEGALPGQPTIDVMANRWANKAPLDIRAFHEARALMWSGSEDDAVAASQLLERLVVVHDDDVEVISALAEVYGRLLPVRPDLTPPMMALMERAESLAPQSVAALRARAVVATTQESLQLAAVAADSCLALGDDLTCALMKARIAKDDATMRSLAASQPTATWIQVLRLDAFISDGHYPRALVLARELSRAAQDDPLAWSQAGRAAAGVGRWEEALEAYDQALKIDPRRLRDLRARAQLKLMARGAAKGALQDYEAIMRDPAFDGMRWRHEVWREASAASMMLKRYEASRILADKTLEVTPDDLAAQLYRAKALVGLGESGQAEAILRRLQYAMLKGRDGARVYTYAAHIYYEMGKKNAAMEVLRLAREEEPSWPENYLERARIQFAMDNSEGAVDDILRLGHLDLDGYRAESPINDLWLPAREWKDLEKALGKEVRRQLKYGKDMRSVVGILALVTGRRTAQKLLERAVERPQIAIEERAIHAHGALAQLYISQKRPRSAETHIRRVLAADSRSALFQGMLGRALSMDNNPDGAMRAFDNALESKPDIIAPYKWKAEALIRMARFDQAKVMLEEVTKRWPADLQAQAMLLEVLERE